MHHQGHETTEVGDDHFRSTGVKLWATVPTAYMAQAIYLVAMADYTLGGYNWRHRGDF